MVTMFAFRRSYLILLLALGLGVQSAKADISLSKDDSIKLRLDAALSNYWSWAVPGDDEYRLIFDRRAELESKMHFGESTEISLLTRVEGFAIMDEDVDVFQDRFLDIPELFLRTKTDFGEDKEFSVVFGHFANRRFLDKDEITPDNYDIGERYHLGSFLDPGENSLASIIGTNSLINSINAAGINELSGATDNGSYGFVTILEDTEGDSLLDRWRLTNTFAVAQMSPFADSFYFATELAKLWGDENPGQFDFGYLNGRARGVARLGNGGDDVYLFYASLVQQYKDLKGYARWGTLNSEVFNQGFSINMLSAGAFYDLSERDTLGLHWVHLNTFFDNSPASNYRNTLLAHLRHNFNENFYGLGFVEYNFNRPTQTGVTDSNMSLGASLQFVL